MTRADKWSLCLFAFGVVAAVAYPVTEPSPASLYLEPVAIMTFSGLCLSLSSRVLKRADITLGALIAILAIALLIWGVETSIVNAHAILGLSGPPRVTWLALLLGSPYLVSLVPLILELRAQERAKAAAE